MRRTSTFFAVSKQERKNLGLTLLPLAPAGGGDCLRFIAAAIDQPAARDGQGQTVVKLCATIAAGMC